MANFLSDYVADAKLSIHIAAYDFRLADRNVANRIARILIEKAEEGLDVRIAYDHRGAPKFGVGDDPAPPGSHAFLSKSFAGTRVRLRPIGEAAGLRVPAASALHHKYVVVDGHAKTASVWTGSLDFTDDAWTRQDNNVLIFDSARLSAYYETDFAELWSTGAVGSTGVNDRGTVVGDGLDATVFFSPSRAHRIDQQIAALILSARESVHIASMLITSDPIIDALVQIIEPRRVAVRGVVDGSQMDAAEGQLAQEPAWTAKLARVKYVRERLASKRSAPYTPGGVHDFMRNKLLVVDDVVVTGSCNMSLAASHNAENALIVRDETLAWQCREYIESLVRVYGD